RLSFIGTYVYHNTCKLKREINVNNLIYLNLDGMEGMDTSTEKMAKRKEFYDELNKRLDIKLWMVNDNSGYGKKEIKSKDKLSKVINMDDPLSLDSYSINKDYNKYLESYIELGRVFNEEDFKLAEKSEDKRGQYNNNEDMVYPVILSNKLNKVYKLGERIEFNDIWKKHKIYFEVIGFLQKDFQPIDYRVVNQVDSYEKELFFIPSDIRINSDEDLGYIITNKLNNRLLILNDLNKGDIAYLQKLSNDLDLKIKLKTFYDIANEEMNANLPTVKFELIKATIIFIFVLVGIIATVMSLIGEQKYKLGVFSLIGYKHKDIIKIYFYQFFIIISIFSFIGFFTSFLLGKNAIFSWISIVPNIFSVGIPLIFFFIILVTIFIAIKIVMNKISIAELMGGFRE
ncbi:MAG: hypothetical protein ACRC7R_06110, partial [Sarcina sp.]